MRDVNSIKRDIYNAALDLSRYEKQGLDQDAARSRFQLNHLNAELQSANAEVIAKSNIEAQKNADAAAERRHKEQIAATEAAARLQAEAKLQAERIRAKAIKEAEEARRKAEIDAERKALFSKFSDEELIKIKEAINSPSYQEMKKTLIREMTEKTAIVTEEAKYLDKDVELIKKKNELIKEIHPKRRISIIVVVGVIAAIVGMVLAGTIGGAILDNTPSLWESSESYGTITEYQVSGGVQFLVKLAVFIPVFLIPTIASWFFVKRDYENHVNNIPKIQAELRAAEEKEKEYDYIHTALMDAENAYEFTYDIDDAMNIVQEMEWKAKYAENEYNNRHYADQSIDSILEKARVKKEQSSEQDDVQDNEAIAQRLVDSIVEKARSELAKEKLAKEKQEADTWTCPNCNHINKAEFEFCGKCGKNRKQPRVCRECGAPLKDFMEFCPKCGAKCDPVPESEPENEPVSEPEIVPENEPKTGDYIEEASEPDSALFSIKNKHLPIIIGIIAAVVILAVIAGFMLLKGDGDSAQSGAVDQDNQNGSAVATADDPDVIYADIIDSYCNSIKFTRVGDTIYKNEFIIWVENNASSSNLSQVVVKVNVQDKNGSKIKLYSNHDMSDGSAAETAVINTNIPAGERAFVSCVFFTKDRILSSSKKVEHKVKIDVSDNALDDSTDAYHQISGYITDELGESPVVEVFDKKAYKSENDTFEYGVNFINENDYEVDANNCTPIMVRFTDSNKEEVAYAEIASPTDSGLPEIDDESEATANLKMEKIGSSYKLYNVYLEGH